MLKRVLSRIEQVVLRQIDSMHSSAAALCTQLTDTLDCPERLTSTQHVIALIGIVGSGKTTFAKILARRIGAVIIEGDAIRTHLRATGVGGIDSSNHVRIIAEHMMLVALQRGANVILDSDFVSAVKRTTLLMKARSANTPVHFVRTVCDFDNLIGGIISAPDHIYEGTIFETAQSSWEGTRTARIVKLRETIRRIPQHYRWSMRNGGEWIPRSLKFPVLITVRTHIQEEMTDCATLIYQLLQPR